VTLSWLATAAVLSGALWIGLLMFRGGFWRADQRLSDGTPTINGDWPAVAVVIPARNEAHGIGRAVGSLLGQDYPGKVQIFVVDDNSDDGTAEIARAAAERHTDRLTLVSGAALEPGWTGKMWAVSQGIARAESDMPGATFLLLTDGDIEHGPGNLKRLVAKAMAESLTLTSLMVKLRCDTGWEKLLIPAFVFFFQKLFPFPWVNNPRRKLAAAAGGCMLVHRASLSAAGGIEKIRDRVIDDCALAALLKPEGPIWLGLTDDVHSLRPYEELEEIWDMVARTAYVQLDHSPLALLGTVIGMALMYLAPPLSFFLGWWSGDTQAMAAGGIAWLLIAGAYLPTLKLYGQPMGRAMLLPFAAALYLLMTLDSARRHYLGRGGAWKGRSYDAPTNHP
jgi:hopene-associated glycosyltransferase HpnB